MRVKIPFASVLFVASLSCIWATPIAVDRGSMIQEHSESHMNERATHAIQACAPIQGSGALGKRGQKQGTLKPEKHATVTVKYEVESFKLIQATKDDVDEPVCIFITESFHKKGITLDMKIPNSTNVLPVGAIAVFEFKVKDNSDPESERVTFSGTWDPRTSYGSLWQWQLFYDSQHEFLL
ncbi:hypothetical protein BDP27DRAFT_1370700 [Rhodocollybia butyracea]|uniref:Uncharacterized protein n=1 Tax=Rhodocollybia butyracea TaxID=206335 RepID=A0A9P5TY97_9AGAR|nr:hypothetical protein BDP27DRAFT_1370700 [Rhodocollybia butyracea]